VQGTYGLGAPTEQERPGLNEVLAAVRAGGTLVVPKLHRFARPLPDAREHHRGHDETFPGAPAADRDDHEDLIPKSQQVMQFQTLPAMKEYTATPLSNLGEGAATSRQQKWAPQGPVKGDLYTFSGPQAPEQGKHVPEVGLELHSSPCEHWELPETCGIRPDPTPVRPSPKPTVCTLYTPPNSQVQSIAVCKIES
jgi:hypothetical protein